MLLLFKLFRRYKTKISSEENVFNVKMFPAARVNITSDSHPVGQNEFSCY